MKKAIRTDQAPLPLGPYSQAVMVNDFCFLSGQIALKPDGTMVEGNAAAQTKQIMENLGAVLKEAGLSYENIVKTTIYISCLDDFAAVNQVYGSYFSDIPPARATVETGRLPKGAVVEIEAIAHV